jgi:hypothetical protein
MNRKLISDWTLTTSVAAGLFFSPALAGLIAALLIRGRPMPVRWKLHHTMLVLATLWALIVMFIRGFADAGGLLSYYAYIWVFPLLMAIYKPDARTLAVFSRLILVLFAFDLAFNIYASLVGQDLLGRVIDARDGLISKRYGGLFGHSFYSGAISISALITLLTSPQWRWVIVLAVANLIMAGSWRLTVAVPLMLFFAFGWKTRSRRREWIYILLFALAAVLSTIWTSGTIDEGGEVNPANTFRVYAWVTAIDRIGTQPLLGIGFPKETEIEGMSFDIIDENLIAESWYLGTAITFGTPYTVLMFAALFCAFYITTYQTRGLAMAILVPFVMVDLTYGGFMGSILIYTWIWLLVSAACERVPRRNGVRPAGVARRRLRPLPPAARHGLAT